MRRFALLIVTALLLLQAGCATTQQSTGSATSGSTAEPAAASTDPDLPADALQTPGERYWQLRFALGLTQGVDDELLAALEERFGGPDGTLPGIPDLADYQGAGYRIASSNSILEALTDLAVFNAVAGDELRAEILQLETDYPERIAALSEDILAEEILIVRSVIMDSLESLKLNDPAFSDVDLATYQEGTLRARNNLEYVVFSEEMDALADRSIADTTGRLDAFHRMLGDNEDDAFLRERILATEEMNRQLTDEHRQYAARRAVQSLFFLLPAISRYLRYR